MRRRNAMAGSSPSGWASANAVDGVTGGVGARMRVQPGVMFATIGDDPVLFSAETQALFSLDPLAAYVWTAFRDGLDTGDIIAELAGHGLDAAHAVEFVGSLRAQWMLEGLVSSHDEIEGRSPSASKGQQQNISLAGIAIAIAYDALPDWEATARIFSHLACADRDAAVSYDVRAERAFSASTDYARIYRDGRFLATCRAEETAAVLKAIILEEVLRRARYELALHTAMLVAGDRAFLLCGHPGAGKSTLTVAAVARGFQFGGDDVSLLHASGRVSGVPFATTVKPGSWPLVARYRPDVERARTWLRPDGVQARFLVPDAPVEQRTVRVGGIVLLDRHNEASCRLLEVARVEGLQGLLDGAYATGEKLTTSGFEALVNVVNDSACYRLQYDDLDAAAACLADLAGLAP